MTETEIAFRMRWMLVLVNSTPKIMLIDLANLPNTLTNRNVSRQRITDTSVKYKRAIISSPKIARNDIGMMKILSAKKRMLLYLVI